MMEVEQLRTIAHEAAQRAERAREVARGIARRRVDLVTRDDAALARHTDDVWRSRAAARSRTELERNVGFSLWVAAEDLRATEIELEARARQWDADARHATSQADAVVIVPVVVSPPVTEAVADGPPALVPYRIS